MKTLIVYYSYTGNTRAVAETIRPVTGADMLRLVPNHEKKMTGFMKYLWGGKQVLMNRTPELEPFKIDPGQYDLIFLGSPVWAFTFAPAMRSFLEQTAIRDKKIALFCCHAGGVGKIFRNFQKALPDNECRGTFDLYEPLSHRRDTSLMRARDWAASVISKCV